MRTLGRLAAGAAALAIAVGVLHGCASAPADTEASERAAAMMKSSFRARGQAKLDRLDQDETQRLCSEYAGRTLPAPVAERIEQANLATIRYPADGKRIRLQDLPNLTKVDGAQKAYTTWPAYRVSQGELRTFQWRLNDCFRQQRFPELVYGSDASIALTAYLAGRANGAEYDGPAIKR